MGKRMYMIFKIIQASKGKAISALDIVKELEKENIFIDVKTVYSCIQRINEFFDGWVQGNMIVPLKKTGFMIEKEFFEDGELQFLFDSISFHEDLRKEDKILLQQKLLLLSSYHQKNRLVDFTPKEKNISFSLFLNLSTLMKAIENKHVLSFQYITYDVVHQTLKETPSQNGNHQDQYIISPYQIVLSNNHYYLIGYNEKHKNELTTYRVDRMRKIQTIKQAFIEVREQFDMSDEIARMTNMYITQQRDTLMLECDKRLLREIASHFGQEIKAKKLFQQHYLISIEDVPMSEGLIGWIFMLQDQIKVISPDYLKADIKNRIQRINELYHE